MASQTHDIFAPRRSFVAAANLSKHTAVALSSMVNGLAQVTTASAGDVLIGVTDRDCVAGDMASIELLAPTFLVMADAGPAAITAGAPLIVEANGIFVKATNGAYTMTAIEALASGTGYIEAVSLGGEIGTVAAGEI